MTARTERERRRATTRPGARDPGAAATPDRRERRATIGFQGGGALAIVAAEPELERLREALAGGGWHDLATRDGTIALYLGQVVYVDLARDGGRVGFGARGD